jgi:hypothetical protein
MKQIVVVALAAFAVGAAVTSLMRSPREHAAGLEQSGAQQEELTRRLDRLGELLTAAAGRGEAPQPAAPQGAGSNAAASRSSSTKDAAKSEDSPEKRAQHAERLQTANTMVDHAIQTGQWSITDMAALGAATDGLSREERDQLMSRLTVAINSDQIRVDMRRRLGQ